MGFWRSLLSGDQNPLFSDSENNSETGPSFAVDENSIDPAVFGLTSYASPTAPAPRVDRRTAIQVPAVKRSRDLICGTLGGLPLDMIGPEKIQSPSPLFEQPERNVPRSVTMTRLFEDLFFEQVAWWRIVDFSWNTYPKFVQRIDPKRVTVDEDRGKVYIDGKHVEDQYLIRFDSPTDGLLIAGARAIRTCLSLESAAQNAADGVPPTTYFTPSDGVDPFETSAEGQEFLNDWETLRRARATGYVPASLKLESLGWNPEQLQLAEARQHAVLEIARIGGVDPEELGVSTTSRTYANQQDRRKNFLDFTLGQYRQAVEDRLSMGDVTPRGFYAKFNLSSFLRSDDKTRMETYKLALEVGAIAKDEIRSLEDKPVLSDSQIQESPVAASESAEHTFDTVPEIRLDASTAQAFEVDVEKRLIKGLLVPYGKTARSNGQMWQFSKGSLKYSDISRVKLWIQHDPNRAVGVATELDDREDGLYGSFKVARGAKGDEALSYAEDGVLDGFSVGLGHGGKFRKDSKTGINHAIEAPLMETSLTPAPSFDDARVHSVAASAATEGKEPLMGDENTIETPEAPDFSTVTDAIKEGFENLQFPQRETVSASASFEVSEPSPYRFDGKQGAQSFSEDMRSYNSNPEARQRLETFMEDAFEQFAVTTGNTGTLNPTQNRPDLFVPNLTFTRPLWDLVTTGVVDDKTPFTIPKFASAAGLVAAHTEGTEPTPGSFTATSQTITPSPVSGKVEINREVWDQGGSPQADQIIWGEMLNGYFEALESKIASTLAAVPTAEINLASAVDEALVDSVQNVFVDLQYVRGGNRFSALALDGMLFKALVNASDTSGRKLLPVVNPSNSQGSTTGGFDKVQIGSMTGAAAWALGASNTSQSYLFVPSSVYAWASAPKKFIFEYQVKSVDMAIWGYSASAITRDSDVKPIDYTSLDA